MTRFEMYPFTIYAVRGDSSGLVKIGITYDIKVRLQSLKSTAKEALTVLLTVKAKCPKAGEQYLLKRYAPSKVGGRGKEWFALEGAELDSLAREFAVAAKVMNPHEAHWIESLRQGDLKSEAKQSLFEDLHNPSSWERRFQAMLDDLGIPLVVKIELSPGIREGKDT